MDAQSRHMVLPTPSALSSSHCGINSLEELPLLVNGRLEEGPPVQPTEIVLSSLLPIGPQNIRAEFHTLPPGFNLARAGQL